MQGDKRSIRWWDNNNSKRHVCEAWIIQKGFEGNEWEYSEFCSYISEIHKGILSAVSRLKESVTWFAGYAIFHMFIADADKKHILNSTQPLPKPVWKAWIYNKSKASWNAENWCAGYHKERVPWVLS